VDEVDAEAEHAEGHLVRRTRFSFVKLGNAIAISASGRFSQSGNIPIDP
jgi:hypothetical protein